MEVKVRRVEGYIVFDSRGSPTIEVSITSERGFRGRFASPSGKSVGKYEAPPLPKDGILGAKKIVDEANKYFHNFSFSTQAEFDDAIKRFDGGPRYERIGTIVSLGLSFAAADLASNEGGIPMYKWIGGDIKPIFPIPICNVLGGGKHALNRSIDIQEILVFPLNARSYRDAYTSTLEVYRKVSELLSDRDMFFTGGRNDEGAWVTTLTDEEAFDIVWDSVDRVRSEVGVKFGVGIDMASSSLWDVESKVYVYRRSGVNRDREEQIEYVIDLVKKHNIQYVEDPLHEDDFPGFSYIRKRLGNKVLVVGDDLYVTNISRIKLGISERAGNAVIIKPNQVGDVSTTFQASKSASEGGFKVVVSHRSGETHYPHLAHLALAVEADMFKVSPVYGERVIKHNELLLIEDLYGSRGVKRIW
ncbi:TPA: hypothetical protein EYP83_00970 [Candidatus Geothermarchaeota archaeon]|nr:hypothetical protein [Candidatus Geothermarchaeota archaeon]